MNNKIFAQFGNNSVEDYLQIICVGADEDGITELFRTMYPDEWIEITTRIDRTKAIAYESYYDSINDTILSEKEIIDIISEKSHRQYMETLEGYKVDFYNGSKKITDIPEPYRGDIENEYLDVLTKDVPISATPMMAKMEVNPDAPPLSGPIDTLPFPLNEIMGMKLESRKRGI